MLSYLQYKCQSTKENDTNEVVKKTGSAIKLEKRMTKIQWHYVSNGGQLAVGTLQNFNSSTSEDSGEVTQFFKRYATPF